MVGIMPDLPLDPSHAFLERHSHPLLPFFAPKSVAIIGATETAKSVGNTLTHNLIKGGFQGKIYPINPKYQTLFGMKCFPSIGAIDGEIDLAVIITKAEIVPQIIEQCVAKNIPAAIIISAGFKELGAKGLALENLVLKLARAGNMRLVGPNCLGIMNPLVNFNATFAASMALKGKIAFLSQSGAMCTAVLDWSLRQKIGFSAFVSVGSMADVNWGDLIDYLGSDPHTSSILMYMETIGEAKDFLSAAREVALTKPIIVIKAGRTEAAAKAAASHTGSMAGSDDVFDAAMRRVGVLRVDEIGDLFEMAEVLAKQPTPHGPRLTILTNAGGPAVLATDAAARHGAEMSSLAEETIEALNEILPPAWSHSNPVDLLGDAGPERYAKALEIVAKDPHTDGILTILSPQDMTDIVGTAQSLVPYAHRLGKPILASWMGGDAVQKGIDILSQSDIPTFGYPDSASRTFAAMWRRKHAIRALYETPFPRDDINEANKRRGSAEAIIQNALKEGRLLLTESESKEILHIYSIPIVQTLIAHSIEEAVTSATQIGYPVVLKLHSETITHKTDVGGVLLNIKNAQEVKQGFETIKKSVAEKKGAHHFLGVTVQKMVSADGYEIILGSSLDPQFGPVILFGTGGQLVEVYRDKALGLPPLNATLARQLMSQTKIYEALKGVRGREAVNFPLLEQILIAFSDLVVSHPHIVECDINPLRVSDREIIALDGRIVLSKEEASQSVIRPYPSEYISTHVLKNGQSLLLRPVRSEDEPLMIDFHKALSEETVRARYFADLPLDERTSHERMIRICHTDYAREILLLALKEEVIVGAVRLTKTPLTQRGNLKIIIIDAAQKEGIGTLLLKTILDIAKREKLEAIDAQILSNNIAMKKMLTQLRFSLTPNIKNRDVLNATIHL